MKRNAAATCREDAGKRRLSQPLEASGPRAPGGRHRRPEAARPRGRDPRVHRRGGQIQPPQAGSGQLRPRALGLPGTPAPCKSILMAVAGHADSLTPHPQNAFVSSLETGPSPRSCRRRLRAPFTFSRPSHPEGRRCRRHRRRGPRTPPPRKDHAHSTVAACDWRAQAAAPARHYHSSSRPVCPAAPPPPPKRRSPIGRS